MLSRLREKRFLAIFLALMVPYLTLVYGYAHFHVCFGEHADTVCSVDKQESEHTSHHNHNHHDNKPHDHDHSFNAGIHFHAHSSFMGGCCHQLHQSHTHHSHDEQEVDSEYLIVSRVSLNHAFIQQFLTVDEVYSEDNLDQYTEYFINEDIPIDSIQYKRPISRRGPPATNA